MKINKALVAGLVIFSLLTIPFIETLPYLDGNIDFVKTYDFFTGRFTSLFANWRSIHPPAKEIITAIFFTLGGVNPVSYNLIGLIFGLVGIIVFYRLCEELTSRPVANIAVFLLCSSPLFVSTSLFSLTDYLLTIFILASFYFYSKHKFFSYFLFASLAVLTKETGIVLVVSILVTEVFWFLKKAAQKSINFIKISKNLLIALSPLISIFIWFLFLKISGKTLWSDWNYSGTTEKGTISTILNNLFSLKLFNKYAYQNWLQLLLLNFNWVFWIIAIMGVVKNITSLGKNKTLLNILLFFLIYLISVLSFQTYTIPRYALPLEPFILMAIALGLYKLSEKSKTLKLLAGIFIFGITAIRLVTSIDPISLHIWGKTNILGQRVYALNRGSSLSGFDGITYNLQYNLIAKKRTQTIFEKISEIIDCSWIFPDPNNDSKTIKILNLKNINCYLQEENQ